MGCSITAITAIPFCKRCAVPFQPCTIVLRGACPLGHACFRLLLPVRWVVFTVFIWLRHTGFFESFFFSICKVCIVTFSHIKSLLKLELNQTKQDWHILENVNTAVGHGPTVPTLNQNLSLCSGLVLCVNPSLCLYVLVWSCCNPSLALLTHWPHLSVHLRTISCRLWTVCFYTTLGFTWCS